MVVIAGGVFISKSGIFGSGNAVIISNEMKFAASQGYAIGKELVKQSSGADVLIITSPNFKTNKREQAMVDGLKEAVGSALTIKAIVNIPVPKPKKIKGPNGKMITPDPMMEMGLESVTAEQFNKLIARNRKCKAIVTLIGLPRDVANVSLWEIEDAKARPKVYLLSGEIYTLKNAIAAGYISAAVIYKRGVDYEKPPVSDLEESFNIRYQLVTPKNVKKLAEANKGMFEK
jgi:hypothetical protein